MPTTGQTHDETAPTVFVIDDDVNVRGALARLIHSLGMQVATAHGWHIVSGAVTPYAIFRDGTKGQYA